MWSLPTRPATDGTSCRFSQPAHWRSNWDPASHDRPRKTWERRTSRWPPLPPGAAEQPPGTSLRTACPAPSDATARSAAVWWTPEAESDLQLVVDDPAVRDQLKRNAEVTLHEIEASAGGDRRSEGCEGEVMWHRGWDHEQERRESWYPEQADDGPWNYVLFYRSAAGPAEFVVLAVRSRLQIADRIWEQMQNGSQPSAPAARRCGRISRSVLGALLAWALHPVNPRHGGRAHLQAEGGGSGRCRMRLYCVPSASAHAGGQGRQDISPLSFPTARRLRQC